MNENMCTKKQNKKTEQKKKKTKTKNKNKTKNPLFPKFQLIPILRFWVMHEKLLSFHTGMISAYFLLGIVLLWFLKEGYGKMQKNK